MKPKRFLESKALLAVLVASAFATGCGGGSTSTPPPPPPVANNQSVSTNKNTAIAITLAGTPGASGDTLTFGIATNPAHGALSGTPPNTTYTPTTGYAGPDSFTFNVSESDGATSTTPGTVSINVVQPPPVAMAQSVTTTANTPQAITLTATPGTPGDTLTYAIVTNPAHGTLTGTAPNVTYTPATGYIGPDSFTFDATENGAASNTATVSITVAAGPLSLSLSSSTVVAPQDGTPGTVGVTVSGASSASSLSVTASNLPSGVSSQFVPAAGGLGGTLSLTATSTTPSGTYSANVVATDGTRTASQPFTLVIAIAASVANAVDTTLGVGGKLEEFMSTSFQASGGNYQFFQNHTATEPAQLNKLGPQHIRVQVIAQSVPMKANTGSATDWDFSSLDSFVQPVLSAGDNSPEFQLAVAPAFLNDLTTGHFIFNTANVQAFANYSANLVSYYNKGGFTWGGTTFVSPSYPQHRITWWGIFNEYNINGLTAAQYIQLYNAVVPAMLSVDSTIKFSALELAVADPTIDLPPFVAPPANGGVNAQVNVVSTHFYPTCNQQDTDTTLFSRVPQLVQYINYVYQELRTRSDLASVPLWLTENNVNSDYPNPDGTSNCNPTVKFVSDPRGTSPFFAAFRPYVFSQFGKAGNQALYHWVYAADTQYGEVDFNTGITFLSYWVDYWLAQMFPSSGPNILQLSVTETSSVEILATKNADGSVAILIVDHAVHAPTDNNGVGDPRTVIVDVSALGTFSSATSITIDKNTNPTSGPAAANITPAQKISVTPGGYGVTFLTLKP